MATAPHVPAVAPGAPSYESFLQRQLLRAGRRTRAIDAAFAGLVLAAAALAYGICVGGADKAWELSTAVRLAGWLLLVGGAVIYVGYVLARVLWLRVNPQYLALCLEKTVPGAKNSIINWLDLRDRAISPTIRSSLGKRAAKDASKAETDQAVSARRLIWPGVVAGALLLVQFGWYMAAPAQARSLLGRAFFPFDKSSIAAKTRLELIAPAGGDAAVGLNQAVVIRIAASGYVPALNQQDSLKLHFRYHDNEPFEQRPLVEDLDGTWTTTVHADQVRSGFWYKIAGGDACLPADREYRIDVRAAPRVLSWSVDFKYREYLHRPDKKVAFKKNERPSIRELRGTEATVTIVANRALDDCRLEITSGTKTIKVAGAPLASKPDSCRFTWVLDESGEFRVVFKTKDGDANVDRNAYVLDVLPDRAPLVVLTKPGADVTVPLGSALGLEGYALDDFGVKSMQLAVKIVKAPSRPDLRAKPYRDGAATRFQLANGLFPSKLAYSDFVVLDTLRTIAGEPFALAPGMELEYWLEARDNCDYPDRIGNLGQSARYKLIIGEPEKDKKKQSEDRQSAQQQAQKGQSKQDQDLAAQNAAAKAQNDAESTDPKVQEQARQNQDDLKKQTDAVKNALANEQNPGKAKPAPDNQAGSNPQPQQEKSDNAKGGSDDPKNPDASKGSNPKEGSQGPGKEQGQAGQQKTEPGPGKGEENKANAPAQPKTGSQDPKDSSAAAKEKGGAGDDPKSKDGGKGENAPKGEKKDGPGQGDQAGGAKKDGNDAGGQSAKSEPKKERPGSADTAQPKQKADGAADPKADNKQPKGPGEQKNQAGQPRPKSGADGEAGDKPATKHLPPGPDEGGKAKAGKPNEEIPADARPVPNDPSQASGHGKPRDRKDATIEDVAKLKEDLGDATRRKDAVKGLERIAEQATDERVANAAEKALDQANAPPGAPKTETGSGKEGSNTAKNPTGQSGQGNAGKQDNRGDNAGRDTEKGDPVLEEASKREGNLQLETLQKQIEKLREKLTPKVLDELKWTEKDRDDFLHKLEVDAIRRQQQAKGQKDKLPAAGSLQSLLPSTGPRKLTQEPSNPGNNAADPLQSPPELREAQQLFGPPAAGAGKKR
jgi:hypothetical protein